MGVGHGVSGNSFEFLSEISKFVDVHLIYEVNKFFDYPRRFLLSAIRDNMVTL